MDWQTLLQNYANVLLQIGVGLQPGQGLHISIPVEGAELARVLSRQAYQMGASAVVVRFVDETLEELDAGLSEQDILLEHLRKEYEAMTALSEKEFAFLRLYSPSFLQPLPGKQERYTAWSNQTALLASALRNHTGTRGWTCIACCPTRRWASHVFPDMDANAALDKLWELLFHMTRADTGDPIAGWHAHSDRIVAQGVKMTAAQFDMVHILGPGTDLKVGLIPSHVWGGGRFVNTRGVPAVPNIPTEELATTPDRLRTEGVVSSVRPLNYQGSVVNEFQIRFHGGKAVEWHAKKGENVLTEIITHDDSSCYLGEVAIVPGGGLIGSTNTVYLCTLLDENATCHLALGAGFPMHVREEAMREKVNRSSVHVDFMIGNSELRIYGIYPDGSEKLIFDLGEWTI